MSKLDELIKKYRPDGVEYKNFVNCKLKLNIFLIKKYYQ